MAFGTDAISHGTAFTTNASATTGMTWNHTCGASANKLVVQTGLGSITLNARLVSSVTYNGTALTKLTEKEDGTFMGASIWELHNPPTGSSLAIVVKTVANEGTGHTLMAGGAQSFNESNATNGTAGTATGTTANPSVTLTTDSGDICVGAYASDLGNGGTSDPTSPGVQIWEDEDVDLGDCDFSAIRVTASGSSTAVSWTAASGQKWAICAIPIKAASGGAAYNALPVLEYYQSLRRTGVFH